MSETIVLSPLSSIFPFVSEENCVSLQLSLTLAGGSFSVSVLKDSVVLPGKNLVISLPFGRLGVVKDVGSGWSSGGLVDTISGPALPLAATQIAFAAIVPGALHTTPGSSDLVSFVAASVLAKKLVGSVNWAAIDPFLRLFQFRGVALSGVQQLAQVVLGDVVINRNQIWITNPGVPIGPAFSIAKSDIINARQEIDYSLDHKSVLNPALLLINTIDNGDFVYDDEHAQKQGGTTVRCGAPSGITAKDFVEIPDGWMIDGNFEDWVPTSPTDKSNPASSALNGRYWKVFQSPANPNALRGVLNFRRLVKNLNLPGNVSTFVGSPVTAQTQGTSGSNLNLSFDQPGTQSGIFGFTADKSTIQDIVSGQYIEIGSAMILLPPGGSSGDAATNFFTIQTEQWTFPRVNPVTFGTGDPTNPFNLPSDVVVVSPSTNVVSLDFQNRSTYFNGYFSNYRLINSPRLKTTVSCVYRNYIPQPGDSLSIAGLAHSDCGRISSVTLSMSKGGITLNIQAEFYLYGA